MVSFPISNEKLDNTVVMRGIVTFKSLDPEWKGHWSFLGKDSKDTVIRPQTLSFKRSNRVWTFIPDKEKQNYNTFTNANRKGKKQAFPEYQEYLSTHLKKYACEFCGLWNGLFYMENPHDQIKESFRLGLAYYGSVSEFDPSSIPSYTLSFQQYADRLLYETPVCGIIVLYGMGENEFGLFKVLVCVNVDQGLMTTIKCYIHDHLPSSLGYPVGSGGHTKQESLEAIRARLLDPKNRKRKPWKTNEVVEVCDVCNGPADASGSTASSGTQLLRCTQCGVRVHPVGAVGVCDA